MTFDDDPAECLLLPLTLCPALAAESGAASVSHGVSEWGLVWVSPSGCLKRRPWQLGVGVTIGVAVEVAVAVAVAVAVGVDVGVEVAVAVAVAVGAGER